MYIREKMVSQTLTLEDVFNINDNVSIQIIIAGYDAFSGARKLFLSKRYLKEDIIFGKYIDNTLNINHIDDGQ